MGLLHFEENANYRYGIWKMEENEIKLRKMLVDEISVPRTNPGKRTEFLSVRALAKFMDLDPSSIDYLPSGKPYIKENNTSISISHTKGYVTLMLSDLQYIGTDIEQISERILKISNKFMHPEEEAYLSGLTGNKIIALLLHWSAKESLFKAIPDEGVDFRQELRISDFAAPSTKGSFKGTAIRSGLKFQIDYHVEKDFVHTSCFPLLLPASDFKSASAESR